jgi:hypothetical protein
MRIEVLYMEGCPAYQATVERVSAELSERGLETEIRLIRVESEDQARILGFLGSPTVRIDGVDIEPGTGDSRGFGFACRVYATPTVLNTFRQSL